MYESPVQVNQETVGAMLPKLGKFHPSLVHVMGIYYFFFNHVAYHVGYFTEV